jgi:hypothetical protein
MRRFPPAHSCACLTMCPAHHHHYCATPTPHPSINQPGVRPVPLEIHMHGLDIHNFEARMQVSATDTQERGACSLGG